MFGFLRSSTAWQRTMALAAMSAGVLAIASATSPAQASTTPSLVTPSITAEAPGSLVPVNGKWQEFSFKFNETAARGCPSADPTGPTCPVGPAATTEHAAAPAWNFTGPAIIKVTDMEGNDERYDIFDGATLIGSTDFPFIAVNCGEDPDVCFANPSMSQGTFTVGGGAHSITIKRQGVPVFAAFGYFRVDMLPACTLNQTLSYSGGNLHVQWTLSTQVATTWRVHLVVGGVFYQMVSAPLPITPALAFFGPFNLPLPQSGLVAMVTSLSTPNGTMICADWDLVDTGLPPGGLASFDMSLLPDLQGVLPSTAE